MPGRGGRRKDRGGRPADVAGRQRLPPDPPHGGSGRAGFSAGRREIGRPRPHRMVPSCPPERRSMPAATFASRANLELIEDFYARWRADPAAVDETWRAFFEGFELAGRTAPARRHTPRPASSASSTPTATSATSSPTSTRSATRRPAHPLLQLDRFGLTEADLDRTFDTSAFLGLPRATLRDLLAALQETYCRTIGVEYMHIQDTTVRQLAPGAHGAAPQPAEASTAAAEAAHPHDAALRRAVREVPAHPLLGQKRFSLEGAETLIPMLDAIVEKAPTLGVKEIRHRHGPPRPAQRAGQHPAQAVPGDSSPSSRTTTCPTRWTATAT